MHLGIPIRDRSRVRLSSATHVLATGVAAVILTVSGGAKLHSGLFEVHAFGADIHHLGMMVLAISEIMLAAFLFFDSHRHGAWLVALSLFTAFFAWSVIRDPTVSCGCFGRADFGYRSQQILNAIAISFGIIGLVTSRRAAVTLRLRQVVRYTVVMTIVVFCVVGGIVGASADTALSGRILYCRDVPAPVTHIDWENKTFVSVISVYNVSDVPVTIVGFKPKCGTGATVNRSDAEVAPGGSIQVTIHSRFAERGKEFHLPLELYADRNGILIENAVPVRVSLIRLAGLGT